MRKINVLVLCLVCSWVLTAGFFSPSPGKHSSKDDVRVNDKERVVIGVDERDDGNSKVSVSPDEVEVDGKGLVGNAKDKIESFVGRRKQEVTEGVGEGGIGAKAKESVGEMKEKTKETMIAALMGVVHLVGLAVAYGMSVWVTFASNYVVGGVLGSQQLTMVQSRMYPLYFKAMAGSVGMALLGHIMHDAARATTWPHRLSVLGLVASLAMILVNLLYLEPRAAKAMSERMKKEKEEGKSSTLINSHSHSSLLNLATLFFLTSHLLHLAYRLHALS